MERILTQAEKEIVEISILDKKAERLGRTDSEKGTYFAVYKIDSKFYLVLNDCDATMEVSAERANDYIDRPF